jgi:alanyl-tRNA synthetase
MGDAYAELRDAAKRVADVLKQEEERFAETLEHGMGVLEGALASGEKLLDGDTIFKLYDTFGFPVDLTADICRERGVSLDLAGFEARWASSASVRAPPASFPLRRAWTTRAARPNSAATRR